jgi:hypothetical protein
MISTLLLRIAVVLGLIGFAMGIAIGVTYDFTLAPAHAHLNLLGFVALFVAGLYYQTFPQAAVTKLAKIQAAIAVIGAALFPAGIAAIVTGHENLTPITVTGALTVFAGLLLFAWIVFRTPAPKSPSD